MITAPKTASKEEFESLLNAAVDLLKDTLAVSDTMSNMQFEEAVCRAMQKVAKDTPFHGKIEKTDRGAFPDIVADRYYGVECKQIQKGVTRTRGNSIFESTRTDGMEYVYLVMSWDAGNIGAGVKWRRYEEAIANIVITHSPRYLIDVDLPPSESLFDKIETPYNEFRKLDQSKMMTHIHRLYKDSEKALWWLEGRDRQPFRPLETMGNDERYKYIGEAFFLCPCVFGDDHKRKFLPVLAYWLSQGIVTHVVRDKFTSSGKSDVDGVYVRQVIRRAVKRKHHIIKAAESLSDETIEQFWERSVPDKSLRINIWLEMVASEYKGNKSHIDVLRKEYGIS